MTTPTSMDDQSRSPADELTIDRLSSEFEHAWKAGDLARIEDYLDRALPPLRPALLKELLAIELFHRRRRGDTLPFPEYCRRFPDLPETALVSLAEAVGAYRANAPEMSPTIMTAEVCRDANEHTPIQPTLPMRVGDYELVELIAQGGMGVVYRARHIALDREVAVKVLRDRFPADSEIARRFLEEARITGQLQHPGIPPIHQVGALPDGRPFIAMKLIKGQTLADLLAGDAEPHRWDFASSVAPPMFLGKLMRDPTADRGRFIMVFEQVCQAVAYAHTHKVIHRDLKPQNIMVGAFAEVQVMDWGLAKVLGERPSVPIKPVVVEPTSVATEIRSGRDPDSATEFGSLLGTLAFMSPEQAGGEVDKLGPPTDVFGLGAIRCVILTGRPPYVGDDAEQIRLQAVRGQLNDAFQRLDKCGTATAMVALAKRCLAVEPADRPADAGVVADVIATMRANAEERARRAELARAEAAVRAAEERKRQRVLRGFAAVGLILAVGIAIASMIAAGVYQKQRNDLGVAEREQRAAREDATEKLWRSKLEEARSRSMTNRPGQREEALATLSEALASARQTGLSDADRLAFRNVAIGCWSLPDVIEEKVWQGLPDRTGWGWTFDFDDSLETYARQDSQGNIIVHRVADNQRLAEIRGSGTRSELVELSPDGRYVAAAPNRRPAPLKVWRLDGKGGAELIHEGSAANCIAVFRADSKTLAYVARDGRPAILDLEIGKVRHLSATGPGSGGISFSPDGQRIGVHSRVNGEWTLQIRNVDNGEVFCGVSQGNDCWHAWHPNGRLLAYSTTDFKIYLWDTSTRQQIASLAGHEQLGIHLTFDASGEWLLSNDWHGLLRIWDVRSGKQRLVLPCFGPRIAVGREGRFAVAHATDDTRLRIMRLIPSEELQEWTAASPTGQEVWDERRRKLCAKDDLMASSSVMKVDGPVSTGISMLDASTGDVVGALNLTGIYPIGFDSKGAMWTAGGGLGYCRWPRSVETGPGTLTFGPPLPLSSDPRLGQGDLSYGESSVNGSVFAVAFGRSGFSIVPKGEIAIPIKPRPDSDVRQVAISPDGRWVVSSDAPDDTKAIRIWDSATGRPVKELPSGGFNVAGFSPDGRWLWSAGGEGRLWHAETWEPGPIIGGHSMALNHDSTMVATGQGMGVIRLVDPNTRGEFAQLRTGEMDQLRPEVFSSDGSRLYAWGLQTRSIFVWDLRLIRKQLKELNLDWNLKDYPEPGAPRAKPLRVEFRQGPATDGKGFFTRENLLKFLAEADKKLKQDAELAYQRGRKLYDAKKDEDALKEFTQALKRNPKHIEALHYRGHAYEALGRRREALNEFVESSKLKPTDAHFHEMQASMHYHLEEYDQALAAASRSIDLNPNRVSPYHTQTLIYALGPERLLDFKKALPLAERAVKLGKDAAVDLNLLGIVHYRLDHLDEAVKHLEQAATAWKGTPPATNRFFLAMAYQRQKNPTKAKELFDQALTWRKTQKQLSPAQVAMLDRLQAEAEKVLAGGKQK